MFKLYDTAFKIGFALTLIFCLILNIYSIYSRKLGDIIIHPISVGGFPITMFDGQLEWIGVLLNIVSAVFFGFIVGLLFRFIWQKVKGSSFD